MIIQIDSVMNVVPPTEPAEGTGLAPWYVSVQSGASRVDMSVWDRDVSSFQEAAKAGAAEVTQELDTYKDKVRIKTTFVGGAALTDVAAAFAQPYRQRKPAAE